MGLLHFQYVLFFLVSFNSSFEPSRSFGYNAVSIVVNLPDLQFERHKIFSAYAVKSYNTATVPLPRVPTCNMSEREVL